MAPPRLFAPLAVLLAASVMDASASSSPDRTVTQVVKLLQGMLATSKTEGNSERDLYAKFKCYCDTQEASKTAEVEKLTKQIGLLENEIEELLASTGILSKDLQQIKRDMVSNKDSRDKATAIRNTENQAFVANEAMLQGAIDQMKDAIGVLAEVGADQSKGDAARDHTQYMANYPAASFAALGKTVKLAMVAASSLASHKQISTIEAFLQRSPFTGAYAAQSGEVVGILKDMLDTFKANLKSARAEESQRLAAYTKLMAILLETYQSLEKLEGEKEAELAANDLSLGTKRQQLSTAQEDKKDAEAFLAELDRECTHKKSQYDERVRLRSEEQAALAEAISILNSDSAFATFGTVSATKTGATQFVQYRSVHKHVKSSGADESRKQTQAFLQREASNQHSPLLGRVVALLQANNPFAVVLEEIEKLIKLIAAEESADDQQLSWCTKERFDSTQSIHFKGEEIASLDRDINNLDRDINDPATGLLAHKKVLEEALEENHEDQVSQTAQRHDENQLYQKDISNLVDAQDLLQRAIVVLRKYYSKIDADISSQLQEGSPSFPSTWEDEYKGQRQGSRSAVEMLEFILKETKGEEKQAHDDELSAQHDYEDSMTQLTGDESALKDAITGIEEDLAQKTRDLQVKRKNRKSVHKEKIALEKYLEDIKPGCDYITANINKRKANRQEETRALSQAETLLKNSPVYLNAVAQAHEESLGECLSICTAEGEDHVKCKACLAKTSVPGYCAGHTGTRGCPP